MFIVQDTLTRVNEAVGSGKGLARCEETEYEEEEGEEEDKEVPENIYSE